ncbi:MAG: substrate-binding domain-containing protein [Candidatus Thermoplasmatota archaeon]
MKKQIFVIGIFLILLIGSIGCFEEDRADQKEEDSSKVEETDNNYNISYPNFTASNYPDVDGSTSAEPLNMLIACKLLGSNYVWKENMDGSKRLIPVINTSQPWNINTTITNIVNHNGTHGSYVNLINKSADLILVARQPSEDELELAEQKNVSLIVEPCAYDAFVFIINKHNIVNNLNISEIQGIYTGNITNWNEVGGNNTKINAYQRNKNSGSQELMETLVMENLEMINTSNMITYSMTGPFNHINSDTQGIGYTVYFYEIKMSWNENIKKVSINGVFPNNETISSGEYPLRTKVYIGTRKNLDKDSNAYKLKEWILSDDGQKIVEETGYVPLI